MAVELSVVREDVAAVDADVLLLKYAQGRYGADETVAARLTRHGRRTDAELSPADGGRTRARRVRFVPRTSCSWRAAAAPRVPLPRVRQYARRAIRHWPRAGHWCGRWRSRPRARSGLDQEASAGSSPGSNRADDPPAARVAPAGVRRAKRSAFQICSTGRRCGAGHAVGRARPDRRGSDPRAEAEEVVFVAMPFSDGSRTFTSSAFTPPCGAATSARRWTSRCSLAQSLNKSRRIGIRRLSSLTCRWAAKRLPESRLRGG